MQAGYNCVIVHIEKLFQDEVELSSGLKLYQDTTYRPEHHTTIFGTVISVPQFKNCPGYWDIKAGDKLYFNYMVVLQPENRIEQYWSVDAALCIARVRAGELKPLGNYILLRPITETTEKIGSIFLPQQSQKKKLDKGIVVSSNREDAQVGDVVVFNKIGKFENTIEGEVLYCAMNNNLFLKEVNGNKKNTGKQKPKTTGKRASTRVRNA